MNLIRHFSMGPRCVPRAFSLRENFRSLKKNFLEVRFDPIKSLKFFVTHAFAILRSTQLLGPNSSL